MYCIWYMLTSTHYIYIYISLHFVFFPQHQNPGRLGGVGYNLLVQLPALLDEALLAIVGPESVFFCPPRQPCYRYRRSRYRRKRNLKNQPKPRGKTRFQLHIFFLGSVDPSVFFSFLSFFFRKKTFFVKALGKEVDNKKKELCRREGNFNWHTNAYNM